MRKTVKFRGIRRKKAEFHLLKNCKKCGNFENYSQNIDKICVHEFNKSLFSLSVSDSELSVELLEALSELKSVLEVAELSVDLDSEVLQSDFGILMAKSVIFWTPTSTQPTR